MSNHCRRCHYVYWLLIMHMTYDLFTRLPKKRQIVDGHRTDINDRQKHTNPLIRTKCWLMTDWSRHRYPCTLTINKKRRRKTGTLINYYFEGFGSSDVNWTLADWIIRLSDLTKHYTGVIASSSLTMWETMLLCDFSLILLIDVQIDVECKTSKIVTNYA